MGVCYYLRRPDERPRSHKDTDAAGEQVKQDKPWLNPNTEAWTKVVKAMKDGYKIEQVKKKYAISKDNQKKLEDEAV